MPALLVQWVEIALIERHDEANVWEYAGYGGEARSVFNTPGEFAKIGTVSGADCPNVTFPLLRLSLPSTRISSSPEVEIDNAQDDGCSHDFVAVEKVSSAAAWKAAVISMAVAGHFGSKQHEQLKAPPFFWRSVKDSAPVPRLNIVIMVIGSRGDIQPFVEIGRILKFQYGHRVRIATHPNFRKIVADDCGLEHFSVGGDPAQLMAFMVKNPGMLPQMETLRSGEIGRRRAEMRGMFEKFWKACIEPGPDEGGSGSVPFVADAIIANPPALVHAHCAERLGCHLHVMFTFPYTPTKAFPHPLATTKASDADSKRRNLLSYHLVDSLTWQGLGDLVNRFRRDTLGLEDVSTIYAASNVVQIDIPWTYLWSPGLVPKPSDWGENMKVVGFPFLDLATSFEPDQALTNFLAAGDPPVYIGFGSIVMEDADAFLEMIVEAVHRLGVRAVISSGWADFAESKQPENIMFVKDVPHDWLFPRCRTVVHHGGAGTTAIGLKCGLPTVIVPFFGDQAFWGSVVSAAKAGAHQAVKRKDLTTELLVESMKQCLTDEAKENAQRIATAIAEDGSGAANAVDHFHEALMLEGRASWRCDMFKDRLAIWEYQRHGKLQLSALAAESMVQQGRIRQKDLKLYRQREWNEIQGRNDPFTGGFSAIYDLFDRVTRELGRGPRSVRKLLSKPDEQSQNRETTRIGASAADSPKDFLAAADQTQSPALNGRSNPEPQDHGPALASSPANSREKQQGHNDDLESGKAHTEPYTGYMVLLEFTSSLFQTLLLILQFPAFFLANFADGFHNLPRVYGDSTVRPQVRIMGFKSGVRAGLRELFLGVWDALIGPIRLPVHDIKAYGALGLLTGLGKSIGGLVCKPCAALFGFPGYTLKGLARSMRRHSISSGIRVRRLALGRMELARLELWEKGEAQNAAARMRKPWYSARWNLMPCRDPKERWWRRRRVRRDDLV